MAALASLDKTRDPVPAGAPDAAPSSDATAPPRQPPVEPPDAREPSDEQQRELKRERKLALDAQRPLEAWERYRALIDTLEEASKLADLGDHKARFALVITGALNVALFFVGTRGEVVGSLPGTLRPWLGVYLVAYALVTLYFFFQAIEALRPRTLRLGVPIGHADGNGAPHRPLGLRFHEDARRQGAEAYGEAWRHVRIDQLNAELAAQAHAVASANGAQYEALRRLYLGLHVMTFMLAGLLVLGTWSLLASPSNGLRAAIKAGKPSRGGLNVLGQPERLMPAGVREASGVACDAPRERLWVVGDEGRLAWLDGAGGILGSTRVAGNLEDVAIHTPSGRLLLLAEKKAELIWYDPDARAELKRWRLDPAALLGREPTDRNQGFEGLAFRPQPGRPGEGVFYLVHQRAPAMLVALAFDPERPAGTLGGEAVVGRFSLEPHADLTAVTWVPELHRLLVVSDADDRILVLDDTGRVEAEVVLPGAQQEGLGFDGAGTLWVADDRAGLLRFPGALQALARSLPAAALPASPAGSAP